MQMWQYHYFVHVMRSRQLQAEADAARLRRLQDEWNGRSAPSRRPSAARAAAARAAAAVSRATARAAGRLDSRLATESRPEARRA